MQQKRLYRAFLVGRSGRIDGFKVIEANSDEEAATQARQLVDGRAVEVWDLDRMIGRYEPDNAGK